MDTFVKPPELRMIRRLGFSEMLRFYVRKANMSTDALASKCGISPYLIRRMLVQGGNIGDNYIPFTLPIVLGIGLELAPSEIHFLLGKAGYALSNPGGRHNDTLTAIIELPYPKTVEQCNSIMEHAGYKRLTFFDIHVPRELNKYRRRTR